MARPIKWSRDLHTLRESAARARIETWSRQDLEHLFGVGRASAQTLMKAIGELRTVAGAHFVERPALLGFLDEMIAKPNLEEAFRQRVAQAAPPPRPRPLRLALPATLRHTMMHDLPENITLEPGRLEIRANSMEAMLEGLLALAMIAQNDLPRFAAAITPEESAKPD